MKSAFIKLRTIIWILDLYACTVQHTNMVACKHKDPFAAPAGTKLNYDIDNLHTQVWSYMPVTTSQSYWLQPR